MRVTFAGVGEAFDERLANTSLLAETEKTSLLIDCGFTAASAFWSVARRPLELDALYISHFHGDHYFGIPALLVRSIEDGRTKPLTILGQPGVEQRICDLMEMAYVGTMRKAQFGLVFVECVPGSPVSIGDMQLSFAVNDHPVRCLSIRVDSGGSSFFYSSDGKPTEETRALAKGCGLVVHESFTLEPKTAGHGTVDSSIDFARQAGADTLALVHIRRNVRHDRMNEILQRCEAAVDMTAVVPESGDCLEL
ncbi:MBL fold metallo-hydrolase [Pseudodesulfovibrio sp. zrk46]|uniref:MBL fold metallo-hydrolase n=1 Tax=Pseudodesulfovibrio sp. zrk46 TaxID=2725288 RepID=UPI001448F886|nr:MBL fold metallo-hydrolase [Pseudodesulfovibrio sp. zrk46]QJB56336.1 MBL fold metallo-hydrolase [Pseudodesulfovibrio sp. zrk46]